LRECTYFGVVNVSVSGESHTPETDKIVVPSRSTLKAWQLTTCLQHLGASDDWAIGMASSSGEAIHREAISVLSNRFSVDPETDLKCPRCYSYGKKDAADQIANHSPKSRVNHFCCGKHLAHFIAGQRTDASDYLSRETEQHRELASMVKQITGEAGRWVSDSCGMPCWAASLKSLAQLWDNLSITDDSNLNTVINIWSGNPVLIGGADRVDTRIIKFGAGRLLAKEGADGLLFVHARANQAEPAVTILIKLAQAANDAQLYFALCGAIKTHVPKRAQLLHSLREDLCAGLSTEFQNYENALN